MDGGKRAVNTHETNEEDNQLNQHMTINKKSILNIYQRDEQEIYLKMRILF